MENLNKKQLKFLDVFLRPYNNLFDFLEANSCVKCRKLLKYGDGLYFCKHCFLTEDINILADSLEEYHYGIGSTEYNSNLDRDIQHRRAQDESDDDYGYYSI